MSNQTCCNCPDRRGGGIFRTCLSVVLLYVVLVFGSGTLINTDNPVARELGKLIQVVTFVEPAINWADSSGHRVLASGLTRLSAGVKIG